MTKPTNTRQSFIDGAIDKAAFIASMCGHHGILHDYRELISDSNIESIQITAKAVTVHFKSPDIRLIAPAGECRTAAIEAINFGDYEKQEFDVVRGVISALAAEFQGFVDIGANAGFYSLAVARICPDVKIYSFEPIPDTCDLLRKNIALNQFANITPFALGLSNEPGEFVFYTYPGHSIAASRERILDSIEPIRICCRIDTLDSIVERHRIRVDLLKCDVEGGELFAFRGALKTLKDQRPVVFSEMLRKWCHKFQYHPNDIIRFFSEIGYDCYAIGRSGLSECSSVNGDTVETNYLFLHRTKHSEVRRKLSSEMVD